MTLQKRFLSSWRRRKALYYCLLLLVLSSWSAHQIIMTELVLVGTDHDVPPEDDALLPIMEMKNLSLHPKQKVSSLHSSNNATVRPTLLNPETWTEIPFPVKMEHPPTVGGGGGGQQNTSSGDWKPEMWRSGMDDLVRTCIGCESGGFTRLDPAHFKSICVSRSQYPSSCPLRVNHTPVQRLDRCRGFDEYYRLAQQRSASCQEKI